MKVTIHASYWAGDRAARQSFSKALLRYDSITLDDEEFMAKDLRISCGGFEIDASGFLVLGIRRTPPPEDEVEWEGNPTDEQRAQAKFNTAYDYSAIDAWCAQLAPEQYLMGSNKDWMYIPISDLEVVCTEGRYVA